MSFYRSDTINYFKFILPRESAWEIMNTLGTRPLTQDSTTSSTSSPASPPPPKTLPLPSQTLRGQPHQSQRPVENPVGKEYPGSATSLHKVPVRLCRAVCKQIFSKWEEDYEKNQKHSISLLDEIDREVERCSNYHFDLSKRI